MLVDKHGLSSCLQKKKKKKEFHTFLGLFTALSFYENHVNTTKAARKGQKLEYNGFTDKDFKYTPVYWDRCQAKCLWPITPLLIGDPRVCGYLTAQMILIVLCVIMLLK